MTLQWRIPDKLAHGSAGDWTKKTGLAIHVVPAARRLFWSELEGSLQLNIHGRTANQNAKISRIGSPVVVLYVEEGERAAVQSEGDLFRFPGLEFHFSETFQLFDWARDARV